MSTTQTFDLKSLLGTAVAQFLAEQGIALAAGVTPASTSPVAAIPAVSKTADGKIVIPVKASAPSKREDPRIPETILVLAEDKATGHKVTLGFSKPQTQTLKNGQTRNFNYGYGLEAPDPETGNMTMTFMTERKWRLMAELAPLVVKAIAENYVRQ